VAYNSENQPRKLQWRFGYAGVYKASIKVPKGGHALLLPYDFNDGRNGVKEDSQPFVWRQTKVATEGQMVCIDGSIYPQYVKEDNGTLTRHPKAGKENREVYESNRKIKGGFIHEYGRMEEVITKYNPYIVDYDGMSNVAQETSRVIAIMQYINRLDHDCVLLVNCTKKLKGQQGPNIKGTTLSEFMKSLDFKRAIRNTDFYRWEIVSKPANATTHIAPMETFVLRKVENQKVNQKKKALEMERLFTVIEKPKRKGRFSQTVLENIKEELEEGYTLAECAKKRNVPYASLYAVIRKIMGGKSLRQPKVKTVKRVKSAKMIAAGKKAYETRLLNEAIRKGKADAKKAGNK